MKKYTWFLFLILLVSLPFGRITTDTVITKFHKLDTNQTVSSVKAHITWDNTNRCVSIGFGNNVIWQAGQEQYEYVHNNSGLQINNGQAVRVSGSVGANMPTAALASASSVSGSLSTIGIATENIPNGQKGYVTIQGLVNDMSTGSYSEGNILVLSTTPGSYSTSYPAKGNRPVLLGIVVRAHATLGVICVCVVKFPFLAELGDVDTSGKATNSLLSYNSSGIWVPTLNPTVTTLNTGNGANELYPMNQPVLSTSDVNFDSSKTRVSVSNTIKTGTLSALKNDEITEPYVLVQSKEVGELHSMFLHTSGTLSSNLRMKIGNPHGGGNDSILVINGSDNSLTVNGRTVTDSIKIGTGSYLKTYLDTTFYDSLLDGGAYKARVLCRLVQVGNQVTLYQPQLSSTSFSIGPIIKGIPSKFLGISNFSVTCFVYSNDTTEVGALEFNKTVLGIPTNFIRTHSFGISTGSGTHGLYPCCLTWTIN